MLWLGQIASQSGDSIYQIGLLWITLELTGSETTTGLVAMASYLPAVILGLSAGVVADRFDRRRVMLMADMARAGLTLLVPLAAAIGLLSPLTLGLSAFAIAAAATFFNPARDSSIPLLVPESGLVKANSLIQTSWQMSLLLGPAAAGAVLHYWGRIPLFYVAALTYLLSLATIYMMKPSRQEIVTGGSRFGWGEVAEGLRFAVGHRIIGPLLLLTVINNLFIMGPAIVGTPVLIRNDLGLGASAYAIVEGCYAIGMLIGAGLLLTVGEKWGKGRVLLWGMVLDGATFIPIFWVDSIYQLEAIIIIHSIAIPFLTISRAALIQRLAPNEMTGRIFAMVNLAVVGMSAISSGIAGPALEAFGARVLFAVIGTGGALCGLAGLMFLRQLKAAH